MFLRQVLSLSGFLGKPLMRELSPLGPSREIYILNDASHCHFLKVTGKRKLLPADTSSETLRTGSGVLCSCRWSWFTLVIPNQDWWLPLISCRFRSRLHSDLREWLFAGSRHRISPVILFSKHLLTWQLTYVLPWHVHHPLCGGFSLALFSSK